METITYRQVGLEDLATGKGTFTTKLADGRVVALTKIRVPLVSSSGTETLTTAATTHTVTFSTLGTADYMVLLEFSYFTYGTATSKTVTGFTINIADPAPSGATVRWIVI